MIFEQGIQVLYSPLGIEQLTVSTTPVSLPNLPDAQRLRRVLIRGLNQPWEWTDDGTTPNGSNGFRQLADEIVVFDSDFSALQLIRAVTATANVDVRIAYYGT